MFESFEQIKIKNSDINQLSADGASNAIGSVAEYESLARPTRSNDVSFNVCIAHQNERSGGLASGTIEFAEPKNEELGTVIGKGHKIQVRIGRASSRMGVYGSVQDKKERNPKLKPKPSVEVRWNSTIDEASRSNQIMGDVCETLSILHGPSGGDYDMLNADERNSGLN